MMITQVVDELLTTIDEVYDNAWTPQEFNEAVGNRAAVRAFDCGFVEVSPAGHIQTTAQGRRFHDLVTGDVVI